MAVFLDTTTEGLFRTTNVSPGTDPVTYFFRGHIVDLADTNFRALMYVGDNPVTDYVDFMWFGKNDTSEEFRGIVADNYPASDVGLGPILGAGEHTFAYTRDPSDDTHRYYIDGVLVLTLTFDMSAATLTHMLIGTDTFDVSRCLDYVDSFMEWSVVRTDVEIAAQHLAPTSPLYMDDLVAFTPLDTDLNDTIDANHWTAVTAGLAPGEITFVPFPVVTAGPPPSEYGGGTPTILTDTYSDHDMQCPASWENGFKAGIVKRFGEGDRAASHPWTGDWQGSQFQPHAD